MKAVKVQLHDAEKAKQYLLKTNNLSHTHLPLKKEGYIYFPVISLDKITKQYTIVSVLLHKKTIKETNLKKKIITKLTKQEQALLTTAFDQIGTIAILEIPVQLFKKEKLIAQALLDIHPEIKTILRKSGIHSGVFRTQKLKYLAGINTKEALYKEHGVTLHLNVEKVYFSPRLSTERKRIYTQIKKGESILVMFSGCGVYPCVIGKNTAAKEIYGIEINPFGHTYALENVVLNKLTNIQLFQGDVCDVIPTLKKKFDRIIMPLPKSAGDFLDVVLSVAKKGTIIHYYDFMPKDTFILAKERVEQACKKAGKACQMLQLVKCGQYSPRTYRICVDFQVK